MAGLGELEPLQFGDREEKDELVTVFYSCTNELKRSFLVGPSKAIYKLQLRFVYFDSLLF